MFLPAFLLLISLVPPQEEKPLLTSDELLEMTREAMPPVERATGRRFRDPVWVRVSTRQDVEKALVEELIPQMKVLEPGADEAQARRSAERAASMFGGILIAKYAWKTGTIHVVPETIRRLAGVLEQPKLLERDVLRVVVTHELVHALDAQEHDFYRRLEEAKTVTALEIRSALSEGHAQHVARRVFEAAGDLAPFEAYEKAILAAPPGLGHAERYLAEVLTSSLKLAYVDGRAFFDALEKTGRKTYVEDVFRNPPTSKNVILRPERYYAARDIPEFDPAPAFEAATKDFGPEWARRTQELDHATLRATYADFVDAKEVEAALKGVEQGHVLVLSPKDAPQSRLVAVAVLRATDAAAAKRGYETSVRVAREKDKRFAQGPIKITQADYGSLPLEGVEHVRVRKTISIGDQKATLVSVYGCSGPFQFEVAFSNEDASDDALKAMIERLTGALRGK